MYGLCMFGEGRTVWKGSWCVRWKADVILLWWGIESSMRGGARDLESWKKGGQHETVRFMGGEVLFSCFVVNAIFWKILLDEEKGGRKYYLLSIYTGLDLGSRYLSYSLIASLLFFFFSSSFLLLFFFFSSSLLPFSPSTQFNSQRLSYLL